MFLYGVTQRKGWFFNSFGVYQKVNKKVYVYVNRMMGFYVLQLYQRSTTGLCMLEARSHDITVLFELGEQWLQKYHDFCMEKIKKDPYYIGNPKWRENCWL